MRENLQRWYEVRRGSGLVEFALRPANPGVPLLPKSSGLCDGLHLRCRTKALATRWLSPPADLTMFSL